MDAFPTKQAAEWHPPEVTLLCEPNIETLFALLEPHAANFLRAFSLEKARAEHRAFRTALESAGVRVFDLREALRAGTTEQLRALCASYALERSWHPDLSDAEIRETRRRFDADVLGELDAHSLVELLLLRPTISLAPNPEALDETSRYLARFEVAPATNAYYMRDPMITTAAGCVVGRLKLAARQYENALIECALRHLGVEPLYVVQAPGHLEGGDFLPCGEFALQGQGLLSDAEGVRQCLEHRVYGFVEVGVVRDPRSQMDEMHLDTYFAVFDRDLCALCEDRLGAQEPRVEVYAPEGTPENFSYRLTQSLPFTSYLKQKGMEILTFTKAEQAAFAPNGVLLAPRRWLGVAGSGEDFARKLDAAGVHAEWLDFSALTGGYGGPHCSSQFLRRRD